MAVIFNDAVNPARECRGRVALLHTGFGGSLLAVDGWGGFERLRAIFTRVDFAEQTNPQFQHTMGNLIYLTRFGDRIGSLSLSGLAFQDNCRDSDRHGIVDVLRYYRRNRLTIREEPLRVTLDPDASFECYLLGIQGGVAPDSVAERLFQFRLSLALLPPSDEEMEELLAADDEEDPEEPPAADKPVTIRTEQRLPTVAEVTGP